MGIDKEKMTKTKVRRHIRQVGRKKVRVKPHRRRIKNRKKYNIKIVSAHDLQYYGGMNHYAAKHLKFKPVPKKNEILIERDKQNFMDSTILHEITEAELMKRGMKFEPAHMKAIEAEIEAGFVPEHVLLETNELLDKRIKKKSMFEPIDVIEETFTKEGRFLRKRDRDEEDEFI